MANPDHSASQTTPKSSTSSPSTQWDLGRFVKTLSYFGAIPFLSNLDWFQQWLGSRANPTVDSSTLSASTASEAPMSPTYRPIFDFTRPDPSLQEVWGALDDVVMGGVSQSGIQFGASAASFSGNVSTANSGGFTSVRTRNFEPPIDLSDYTGIELRVKGDGNRYKFMLRSETQWDGIAYCHSFDTTPDTWMTLRIPFADLIPVFRARTVKDASINLRHITAMQLMLSKFEYDGALNPHFQPGFFQLQVEAIGAYA